MPHEDQKLGEWKDMVIDDFVGGLVSDIDSELFEDNQLLQAQNAVFRSRRLQSDTGYATLNQVVRGNPRKVIEYKKLDGTLETLLITDATVYKQTNNQWRYVSSGVSTTIATAPEAAGQTALTVASIVGFADNDFVGVVLDTGQMHFSQVNGAPAGSTITIDDALPSQASIGNAVIRARVLQGTASFHVVGVHVPWTNNVVFTNGNDNVQLYDSAANGGNGSVTDLTGTGLPANTRCLAVAIFDSSLVLAGMLAEAGTPFPYRWRASAKGDYTLWNTVEATSADLLDGYGGIRQALKLGPYLIFYRENGITRVQVSGSLSRRFQTDPAISGAGVWSQYAAADLTDKHIVMGKDKFFWYRGGLAYEEIVCPIKEAVFGAAGDFRQNGMVPQEVQAIPIRKYSEILFAYGQTGTTIPHSPRFHVDSGKWSRRQFGAGTHEIVGFGERLFSSNTAEGNVLLCLNNPLQVVEYNFTNSSDAGSALVFQVTTKDYGRPGYQLKVDWCEVSILGGSNTFTVEYSTDKGVTWTQILSVVPTGSAAQIYRISQQFAGRTVRFRFTMNQTSIRLNWFLMRYMYAAEW